MMLAKSLGWTFSPFCSCWMYASRWTVAPGALGETSGRLPRASRSFMPMAVLRWSARGFSRRALAALTFLFSACSCLSSSISLARTARSTSFA